MSDYDDVFDTQIDQIQAERIISANDENNKVNKLSQVRIYFYDLIGYSEGYLVSSSMENEEIYIEAFEKGKNYSIEFGIILGKIE